MYGLFALCRTRMFHLFYKTYTYQQVCKAERSKAACPTHVRADKRFHKVIRLLPVICLVNERLPKAELLKFLESCTTLRPMFIYSKKTIISSKVALNAKMECRVTCCIDSSRPNTFQVTAVCQYLHCVVKSLTVDLLPIQK
jgi:hypothetical protein